MVNDETGSSKKKLQKVIRFNCKKINILRANTLKKFLDKELSNDYYLAINFEGLNFIDSQAFDVIKWFKRFYYQEKLTNVDFIIPPGEIEELFLLREDSFGNTYTKYNSLREFKSKKEGKVTLEYFQLDLRNEYWA